MSFHGVWTAKIYILLVDLHTEVTVSVTCDTEYLLSVPLKFFVLELCRIISWNGAVRSKVDHCAGEKKSVFHTRTFQFQNIAEIYAVCFTHTLS